MRHVHSMAALAFSLACGFVSSASADATEDFAVLAGAAVTCTVSSVQGDVGLANPGTITNTSCAITGAMQEGTAAAQSAYATFLTDYFNYQTQPPCDFNNVPLEGAYLVPGVYCYDAAVTVTNSTLTLVGSATDTWIFRIGTSGTGALTGTSFNVAVTGGATCDNSVFWWTAQAATLTDSVFIGSILAGADITITRGGLTGQVSAGGTGATSSRTGAVTLTGTVVDFCTSPPPPPLGPPLLPVFVIGDVEPHAVGNVVNFWGAQWWKNNVMSGIVNPGVASFKGFATRAELDCGGFWNSRPGNSPPPPATIAADIAVVVTSTVIKNGPNLSGDIKEIVVVHQDGGYGPNPGHAGNGVVTSIVCPPAQQF
jgi:hypothetical protein